MSEINDYRFIEKIRKTVGKAVNRYGLIGADDRIAVGLSGGKDSLVLLETLALRRERLPIWYDLFAVHVTVKNINDNHDTGYLSDFCRNLSVPFRRAVIEVDLAKDEKKSSCFVCSWHRRKELFHFVKSNRCNRLALGHHLDDVLETFFMNMTFNGSISAMPPKLPMFSGEFNIIRPLILLQDKDIARYAAIRKFTIPAGTCPHENENKREEIKKIIAQLDRMHRKAKKNIYWSLSNIHYDYLPREE